MPELRKDPIIDRWVIISSNRGQRPTDFRDVVEEQADFSPFASGNEDMTPPEIDAIRPDNSPPNTPGWSLRVVPNKFPALQIDGQLNRRGDGIYDMMNGIGAHEVIIETPDPDSDLSTMSQSDIENVFAQYQKRITDLKKDVRLKYILIFKNHGAAAGATLRHSHSQLIATPIVPKRVGEEIDGSRAYYQIKERCIYCDIIRQELKEEKRVVYSGEYFVAIQPYAARSPFETWILPRDHASHYEDINKPQLQQLAYTMQLMLQKLGIALQSPPYNFVLHTAPVQEKSIPHYHWHIELLPRLNKFAGFEWGTGFFINPTSPEDAANYLREIAV